MARNPHDGLIRQYRNSKVEADREVKDFISHVIAAPFDVEHDEYCKVTATGPGAHREAVVALEERGRRVATAIRTCEAVERRLEGSVRAAPAAPRSAPRQRRRRAGASSSTSGNDPGDPDPEPAPARVFVRREPRAWFVAEECTVDRAGWVHVRDGRFEERTGPNYSTRRRFGRPGPRSWAPGEVLSIDWQVGR